jgi:hypothetical protein
MAKKQIRNYVFKPGVAGAGTIKILDKVSLDKFLLITNVTSNQILYNFADPTNQITVQFTETTDGSDPDYPYANTLSNGVTTINLLFDTSSQSSTDSLQIFIEDEEVTFRPYNFGTDAIERMRVATPQSMLDADFEYGLQPTKWQTIDLMRGYPSLYEIPGSDVSVASIITDASSTTGGVGDSIITVTTTEAHGFSVGSGLRVTGLLDSIFGVTRAEGSFVVHEVPSTTSFKYYAKGKVGTSDGQSLLSSFIQLRLSGFYTGSDIGTPSFSVVSQGSNGTFSTRLTTPINSNRISYIGVNTVSIGAPLTGLGVSIGTQVTGITTTSGTLTLAEDIIAPTNTIVVNDTTGVNVGSAITDGTSDNAVFVTNIVGNQLTLSSPFLSNRSGSVDQIGIVTATPVNFGNGSGALFDVSTNNNSYVVSVSRVQKSVTGVGGSDFINIGQFFGDIVIGQRVIGTGIGAGATVRSVGAGLTDIQLSVVNTGTVSGIATFTKVGAGYSTNDRIIIDGNTFFGQSGINDLVVKVNSVDAQGGITSVTSAKAVSISSGTPRISTAQFKTGSSSLLLNPTDGTVDSLSVASDPEFAFGTENFTIEFWIYRNRTSITEFIFDMRSSGATEVAPCIQLNSSNQLIYFLNGSSVITSTTTILSSTWTHIALTKSGTTTRLFIDGTIEGTYTDASNYSQKPVKIGARGYDNFSGFFGYIDDLRVAKGIARYTSNFIASELFLTRDVNDSLLMFFEGTNNSALFSDDSKGRALDSSRTYFNLNGVSSGSGTGAQFTIQRIGGSSPQYNLIQITNAGSNYSITDTITIDGSILGGNSGTNNLTITVTGIDGGGGGVTSATLSGTAASGNISVQAIGDISSSVKNAGYNAQFSISKSGSNYVATVVNGGVGYYPGYNLLIPGNLLGANATSPANDLSITVSSTNINTSTFGDIGTVSLVGTPRLADTISFFPSVTLSEPTLFTMLPNTTISFSSLARIRVGFTTNHGLVPGNTALISVTSSGINHSLVAGPRLIDEIPNLNEIIYTARAPGNISTGTAITGLVYARPDCFYVHRPFDGGVQLGTGGPSHGSQAIRQSKKYLRYQSGKGIMYTTGALFAPSYDLRSVTAAGTASGSLITVVTDDIDHGLQVGAEIALNDISTSGYNGNYFVNSIVNEFTFTVIATNTLASTNATLGVQAQVSLYKWKGATVRVGAFDDQNGIFWQYDGINLSVGLRSATYQLAGTISINSNSNEVTGSNTRFLDQLIVGNRIVIRGMTHVVTHVSSQTSITVTPDFRGVSNIVGAKASLVNEIIIPQSQWNVDKGDGTGSSGYQIKVNKMQMIGFQYTWYGAGFIDWMLRGPNGDYLFVHRLKNNNRNTEAFMRSGNLPVRYEVINEGARTRLTQNVGVGSTILFIDNASVLPDSGSLYIDNEIINYTGIGSTTNTVTGLTRAGTFSNFYSGSQRSYTAGVASTHRSGTGIVLLSNTATPIISHWGSAFLTDGMFDSDRGYIFNYQAVNFPVSTIKSTAFLLRLSPSVSNAIIGDLGQRELINRAQLLLQGIEFTPTGGAASQSIIIEGILNPQNYPTNPNDIIWTGLSAAGRGGQPSFAQIAEGSSVVWVGATTPIVATNAITQNFRTTSVVFNRLTTAGVRQGMTVSGTGVPGGTTVVGFSNFDATRWNIIFSNGVIPGNAGSTSYTFASAVAALPGETVFSFAGDATQKSTLDLTSLKELNNTPIGGRGTFPNGPDVLAINVYTTGGSAFTGSLALRWGEAQA